MNDMTVQTKSGCVKGCIEGEYISFKGIPYASAKRFEAPMERHWDGVLDCTKFGKKAMQVFDNPSPWAKKQNREEFDEDCLNLNIYLPKGTKPEDKLPVLLEVHGGAYQTGSNQDRLPQSVLKDEKVIYVAINYRLGVLGYLYLGKEIGENYQTSGNNGLLDQLASVRWVYENIGFFGGDCEKITVLGSSAGAKSIGSLMMLPEFDRYAAQVILSSGGTQSIRSEATAQVIAEGYLETLKSMAGELGLDSEKINGRTLLELSSDDIIKVQKIFCDNPGNTCMFGPVADGVILPYNWQEDAVKGTLWSGSAMVGCSRHELGFYTIFSQGFAKGAADVADALFGKNSEIAKDDYKKLVQEYAETHACEPSEAEQGDIWVRVLTDYMYRLYSYRLAKRLSEKGCPVWQYSSEFLPALHCSDQSMAFGKAEVMLYGSEERAAQAEKLGTEIWRSFLNFVKTGNPDVENWQPLSDKTYQVMYWDETSEAREIPEGDVLESFPEEVYIR